MWDGAGVADSGVYFDKGGQVGAKSWSGVYQDEVRIVDSFQNQCSIFCNLPSMVLLGIDFIL